MPRIPVPPVKRITVDDLYPIKPKPAELEAEATWDVVIRRTMNREDYPSPPLVRLVGRMSHRDHVGRAEYGVPLIPHNGRDSLADAQDELLDALVYLENAARETDPLSATATTLREIQAQCLDGAIRIESILGGDAR